MPDPAVPPVLDPAVSALMDQWLGHGVEHHDARQSVHGIADRLRAVAADLVRVDVESAEPDLVTEAERAAERLLDTVRALPRVHTTPATAPLPVSYLSERSPVSGRSNPSAPPIRIRFGTPTVAEVVYTEQHEGPPGGAHGGVVAATFDEVLGVAQMASGAAGYTATLEVRYRSITPLHTLVTIEADVERRDGRRLEMWARSTANGTLCAEARGIFLVRERVPIPGA
jgi:acyl-coenzyme A thioesterase PaaI-like protein